MCLGRHLRGSGTLNCGGLPGTNIRFPLELVSLIDNEHEHVGAWYRIVERLQEYPRQREGRVASSRRVLFASSCCHKVLPLSEKQLRRTVCYLHRLPTLNICVE